jgi:hypothetical protein
MVQKYKKHHSKQGSRQQHMEASWYPFLILNRDLLCFLVFVVVVDVQA